MGNRPKGKFIVLEGIDGCGKSSVMERLQANMKDDYQIVFTRDPGDTELGKKLRRMLLHDVDTKPGKRAEMLLYLAARQELDDKIIRPAIDAGKHVICDRYYLSTLCYQLHGSDLQQTPWGSNEGTFGEMYKFIIRYARIPTITLWLNLPLQTAIKRAGGEPDKLESRSLAFKVRTLGAYIAYYAQYERHNTKELAMWKIDATAPLNQVAEMCELRIRRLIATGKTDELDYLLHCDPKGEKE